MSAKQQVMVLLSDYPLAVSSLIHYQITPLMAAFDRDSTVDEIDRLLDNEESYKKRASDLS